jgi:hypothetical protein
MNKLKSIFNTVKNFINTKGFTAPAALGVGVGLWIFGYKILAGILFGVFITCNWDILKGFVTKK